MTDNSLMMAYDNASEKLQKLLDDNNWDIEVQCKHYPVTYTYRKAQCLLDLITRRLLKSSSSFGLTWNTCFPSRRMKEWTKRFFNKLKNLTKEVHRLYILLWFAQKNDRFTQCWEPIWINQNSTVGVISGRYEP